MFDTPFIRVYSLSKCRDDRGVYCGLSGLFIGSVPLLDNEISSTGKRLWRPRPLVAIDRDLERCYGAPVDVRAKMGGFAAVARALKKRV